MAPGEVTAVSSKLPTFWTDNVETWFAQAEAEFTLRAVTVDSTKYSLVVAALTGDVATAAEALINNPPDTHKYQAIKDFLIGAYGLTDSERAERLLHMEELGTRKPSQLMSKILHLYGKNQHNFLIRHIFIRALPYELQHALANSTEEDLRKLAKEADRLAPLVCRRSFHADAAAIDAVRRPTGKQRILCFYHSRFGVRAKKCEKPCDWRPGNDRTSSQ
mgnify:CR=1 FL=1